MSFDGGAGLGLIFASHGKVAVSVGRWVMDRVTLGLSGRLDLADRFLGFEGVGEAALVLFRAGRWTFLDRWRVGYASFWITTTSNNSLQTGGVMVSTGLEAFYSLTSRIELRLAPLIATAYWNDSWSLCLEPTAGVAYRF